MTFPFDSPIMITDTYDTPRPRLRELDAKHWALDVAPKGRETFRIVVPERSLMVLFCIHRSLYPQPRKEANFYNASKRWFHFSRYYADRLGGCMLLQGDHYWHLFCHLDLEELFRVSHAYGVRMLSTHIRYGQREDDGYGQEFHTLCSNLDDGTVVAEGVPIAVAGNTGYSTGVHVHYELHPIGGASLPKYRVDPAEVWPNECRRFGS